MSSEKRRRKKKGGLFSLSLSLVQTLAYHFKNLPFSSPLKWMKKKSKDFQFPSFFSPFFSSFLFLCFQGVFLSLHSLFPPSLFFVLAFIRQRHSVFIIPNSSSFSPHPFSSIYLKRQMISRRRRRKKNSEDEKNVNCTKRKKKIVSVIVLNLLWRRYLVVVFFFVVSTTVPFLGWFYNSFSSPNKEVPISKLRLDVFLPRVRPLFRKDQEEFFSLFLEENWNKNLLASFGSRGVPQSLFELPVGYPAWQMRNLKKVRRRWHIPL